jgi:hypothetical protein
MKPITFPKLTLPDAGLSVAPTLGHPLVDDYLESVHARLRPNSTLAVVYDLKVFFTVIDVDPLHVRRRHVLEFIRAQRTGSADATVIPIDSSGGWRCRRSDVDCRRWQGSIRTLSRSVNSTTTRFSAACRCGLR